MAQRSYFLEPRVMRSAVITPSSNEASDFIAINSFSMTSSFYKNKCASCRHKNLLHHLGNSPNLYLLVDSNLPPMVGTKEDCCLVIKVDQGKIDQMKVALEFQHSIGHNFIPGSLGIVSLPAHLSRVGIELYLQQLTSFYIWTAKNLNLKVTPGMWPRMEHDNLSTAISEHQLMKILQIKNLGSAHGR